MVEYAVSDLVKEVKVLLDRNQESAGLLAPDDSDTLSQAELIGFAYRYAENPFCEGRRLEPSCYNHFRER